MYRNCGDVVTVTMAATFESAHLRSKLVLLSAKRFPRLFSAGRSQLRRTETLRYESAVRAISPQPGGAGVGLKESRGTVFFILVTK